MAWSSLREIATELGLDSSADDSAAIKKELKARMNKLHPDKTGGVFLSVEDEEKYKRVAEAYEFVKDVSQEFNALVPVSQLPAIIKAVRDAQLGPTDGLIVQMRTECREEQHRAAHNRYILPKIGSGTLASIAGALFMLSGKLDEYPALKRFSQYPDFCLIAALCAGTFFVLTWIMEQRNEANSEFLMTERGRRYIFNRLVEGFGSQDPSGTLYRRPFSIMDVMDVIQPPRARRASYLKPLFILTGIPDSVVEKIAQMHLLELEKRSVIQRVETPSVDVLYRFDIGALKKARPDIYVAPED